MKPLFLIATLVSTTAAAQAFDLSRFSLGVETIGSLSLTPSRTQGGVGGALDVSYAFTPSLHAHASVGWLVGVGSSSLVRLGAGWSRSGTWRPLFGADLEVGVGSALEFGGATVHPAGVPTLALTARVALLRFEVGPCSLSGLELNAGPSTEFVSVGWRLGVKLFALSVALPHM